MCRWYIHIHVHIHIYYKIYISFLHILDFQILCHYTNKCKPKKGITLAKWVWNINEFRSFFHEFYFLKLWQNRRNRVPDSLNNIKEVY